MADIGHPPGRDAKAAYCVNCGQDGHWAFACPEATRAVPAGMRSGSGSSGQGGGHRDNIRGRRSKPVVTKYQPPATNSGMIVTRYAPVPPPPPHGQLVTPPPGPQQFPGSHGYPPYGPGPRDTYGPAPPPPPSWEPTHGPPPPIYYNSLPHYHTQPPPPQYGHSTAPPQLPPPPPSWTHEPPPHPTPYGPPSGHQTAYPRPPPPPSSYSPPVLAGAHGHLPPGYPPPPSYTQPPPPPPASRDPYLPNLPPPPQPQAQNAYSAPPPPASHSPHGSGPPRPTAHPPGLPPRPPSPPRHFRDKLGRHRNKKNHRAADRKDKHSHRINDRKEQYSDRQGRVRSEPKQKVESPPQVGPNSPVNQFETGPQDDDFEWELRTIFEEPEYHQPDETGKPLPSPSQWHDGVVLPRAWDAPSIDSEYLKDKYRDVFFSSIRNTRFWKYLRYDPIFWVDGRGPEVKSQSSVQTKPQPKEKSKSAFDKTPQEILGRPTTIAALNFEKDSSGERKRPRVEVEPLDSKDRQRGRGHDSGLEHQTPPPKRHRAEDVYDGRSRSRDTHGREQRGQRYTQPHERHPADALLRTLEGGRLADDNSGKDVDPLDMAPHSARRSRAKGHQSPGSPVGRKAAARSHDSRSSSASRPSCPRSEASDDSADSGEELSWFEAELLGRSIRPREERDRDLESDSRRRQKKSLKPKKRSAPQMNSVYGRRW